MRINDMWQWLQIFAEGGDGGAGDGAGEAAPAAAGVQADDAGQRLRELGVPESKIRKPRANKATQVQAAPAPVQPKQDAAAQVEEAEKPAEGTPARMSWDEIMKDPEYNKNMQDMMRARLRDAKAAEEAMQTLAPALKSLAQQHGLDPDNMDYVALGKALNGDYEAKAAELGVPTEIVMKLDQQQRTLEQQRFHEHISRLEAQAEAMKTVFPNFDLRAEMQNPTFARMTSPGMGMSVEDAYYAVHRKELQQASMQVAAQQAAKQISNAIASGSRRPVEGGMSSQSPSVSTFDYKNYSKQQREDLKRRIREADARGEKIYPGR